MGKQKKDEKLNFSLFIIVIFEYLIFIYEFSLIRIE